MTSRRNREDDRAAWAQGWSIAYTIVGIGLETALPALLGAWLDRRWNTGPWLLLGGVTVGLIVGGSSLISFAIRQQKASARRSNASTPSGNDRAFPLEESKEGDDRGTSSDHERP